MLKCVEWARMTPTIGQFEEGQVVLVTAGIVLDDRLLAIAGALPAALAVALFVRPLMLRGRIPGEVESLLPVIGADSLPSVQELMETRNNLDGCRKLWTTSYVPAVPRS